MIDEKIKELLDSDLEADNEVGWELIKAKGVPYNDVLDYVEQAKVPTHWEYKYIWDFNKKRFIRNKYPVGATGQVLTSTGTEVTWQPQYYDSGTFTVGISPTTSCVQYTGGSL